jgi:hypothetical protein
LGKFVVAPMNYEPLTMNQITIFAIQ